MRLEPFVWLERLHVIQGFISDTSILKGRVGILKTHLNKGHDISNIFKHAIWYYYRMLTFPSKGGGVKVHEIAGKHIVKVKFYTNPTGSRGKRVWFEGFTIIPASKFKLTSDMIDKWTDIYFGIYVEIGIDSATPIHRIGEGEFKKYIEGKAVKDWYKSGIDMPLYHYLKTSGCFDE